MGADLRILSINTADAGGGAARVARSLSEGYRARGHRAWMAVGTRWEDDAGVTAIPVRPASATRWARGCFRVESLARSRIGRIRGAARLAHAFRRLGRPGAVLEWWRGFEDFEFPGSREVLAVAGEAPDIVQCHNLHGGFFDLRVLSALSRRQPLVLTLHDAWLLTGHCAHSFDCGRWVTGCGRCPDLTIYPAIRRDASAENWQRKADVYRSAAVHVATPCRWLMDRVERSMLRPAIVETAVIPYGVDLATFRPRDRSEARRALGLPGDETILLVAGTDVAVNPWKDFAGGCRSASAAAARLRDHRITLIALGQRGHPQPQGNLRVSFVPWEENPAVVASYFQAADLYLHPARADTFPLAVIEALACGTPVVATTVGGIPEQVRGLNLGADGGSATGLLVPPAEPDAMARAIVDLVGNPALRRRLGENAARDARARFDVDRQIDAYLGWFEEIRHRPRDRIVSP